MKKSPFRVLARYVFLLLISLGFYYSANIYSFFLNVTIYPVNFLLNLFYESSINGAFMLIGPRIIEIIPACVGISAYLLLLILNLTIEMKPKTRFLSITFSFLTLLVINILRIFILTILLINNNAYFDVIHKFLWYFMSFLIVIGIWFLTAYIFKIRTTPIYDDIRLIMKPVIKYHKSTNKK